MKALSLFSGIGGLDLAAEAAGIKTTAFCEIEQYAVKVLERRWPGVPIIDDVRKIKGCDWAVDVIHGGFPCQDLSQAGKQAGLEGERSGLWFEMLRVISEIRPAFVVAENVRGAVNLALDTVQAGMEDEGYEVRTLLLPASAFSAPHKRERMFVIGIRKDVADGACKRLQRMRTAQEQESEVHAGETIPLCDSIGSGELWPTPTSTERSGINPNTGSGGGLSNAMSLWPTPTVNDTYTGNLSSSQQKPGSMHSVTLPRAARMTEGSLWRTQDASCMRGPSSEERMDWKRKKGMPISINDQVGKGSLNPAWVEILMGFPLGWTDVDCDEPEPWPGWPALMGESQYPYEPPRTVTGCPNRAKRLKCLGNAVVPAQARPIFEAIRQIHNFITPNVSRETLLNKIREA
jgi:DNA (cytosine-5)-methyltransferase 1